MNRKLRLFVSSTMRDLANERDAVCRRLDSFNFEAVNAEAWLPTGMKTWPRIAQEIESSDVFVLILGERYGWIPQTGPQSHEGLSVTHLEYKQACSLGIPILPFLKKLDFETSDRESEDAQKRDAFRTEVSDWAEGQSVALYELAGDLADSVGQSLVALLTNEFLRRQIRARAPQTARTLRQMENAQSRPATKPRVQIPASLATAAANREAVMFAGAGISWAGGMPSAAVFSQHLAEVLIHTDPDYAVSPAGSMMKAIASDLEESTSREFLVREIGRILDPPQGLHATVAHEKAIKLFDLILTTNWDGLFEEAATMQNEDFTLITREISAVATPCYRQASRFSF
jgi:hypothetical protein